MIQPQEVPDHIKRLRERAGLSMEQMARAMALKGGSSYQNYETRARATYLKLTLVRRLLPTLLGKGQPPISRAEIMQLAGVEDGETLDRGAVMLCVELGVLNYMRAERMTRIADPAGVSRDAAKNISDAALRVTEEQRAGRVRSEGELRAYVEGLIQRGVQ